MPHNCVQCGRRCSSILQHKHTHSLNNIPRQQSQNAWQPHISFISREPAVFRLITHAFVVLEIDRKEANAHSADLPPPAPLSPLPTHTGRALLAYMMMVRLFQCIYYTSHILYTISTTSIYACFVCRFFFVRLQKQLWQRRRRRRRRLVVALVLLFGHHHICVSCVLSLSLPLFLADLDSTVSVLGTFVWTALDFINAWLPPHHNAIHTRNLRSHSHYTVRDSQTQTAKPIQFIHHTVCTMIWTKHFISLQTTTTKTQRTDTRQHASCGLSTYHILNLWYEEFAFGSPGS